jgi:hypothetical protein
MKETLNNISIKRNRAGRIIALVAFASMFVLWVAPKAHAEQQCSNASLRGAYGFHGLATISPAGTPRAIIGVFAFDGRGSWTANLTIDDNGTITHPPNPGPSTYIVNADCTGTLFPSSGGSVAIVVVDGGKEFYQMRLDPSNIVLYSVTKKLFPGDN